ncbi:MAG: hypothetical protein WB783_05075 [Arenicellales bacterium]
MASLHSIRAVIGALPVLMAGAILAGCAAMQPPPPMPQVSKAPHVLTDRSGMTMYRFDKDQRWSAKSACRDGCAAKWPPVPAANDSGKLFSSFERADGRRQLTYDGWPLYYYSGDNAPGDENGKDFASVWHVLHPRGGKTGATG